MTCLSPSYSIGPLLFFTKEVLMESRRHSGPVIIRFNNVQEVVDITMKIELKYFVMRLLYSRNLEV